MKQKILLVGASTGGPSQIKELLSSIKSLSSTIIIAQHMREEILNFFIKDIKETSAFKVQSTPLTTTFDTPSIIICANSCKVEKNSYGYKFSKDTSNQMFTPDINKLFSSFVDFTDELNISALIMTGIGRDGVDGAVKLKTKGVKIYAQDELSSPVFGMPKAAIESGIVDDVKSLNELKNYFKEL